MQAPLLIVKNITHEGPGLLETTLAQHRIAPHVVDLSKGYGFPDPRDYRALVVLGGPQSANDETPGMRHELRQIRIALDEEIPCFGICLGMQALVKAGGGKVLRAPAKETGFFDADGLAYQMELTGPGRRDPLFAGLQSNLQVFQLHGETVELAASGMTLLATGRHCPMQAVKVGTNAYGLQCHAELTPAMLAEWCSLDADLKRMESRRLNEQFAAFREDYTLTGLHLMNNFLRIAGLA